MEESFINHLRSIFQDKNIAGSFGVYDVHSTDLPPYLDGLTSKRQFVVCTEASDEKTKNILSRFLKKDIKRVAESLVWFDGEPLENEIFLQSQKLKNSLDLPQWLDDLIFNHYRATHCMDRSVTHNSDNSREKNLNYLGTYFPRSYTESFCICDNILCNTAILGKYKDRKKIRILSIGCGTGGDALGIIACACERMRNLEELELVVADTNSDALELLCSLIKDAQRALKIKISLKTHVISFTSGFTADPFRGEPFDFINSSKAINELLNISPTISFYKDFVTVYSELLSDYGFLILSDVSIYFKIGGIWFPELLNKQVNRALVEMKGEFSTLLPLCCGIVSNCECDNCYTQKRFYITHSHAKFEESKIAYRVIVRKGFYESLGVCNQKYASKISDTQKNCAIVKTLLSEVVDGFDLRNGFSK